MVSAIGFGLSPLFATRAFDAGVDPVAASFLRIFTLMCVLSPWASQLRGWGREARLVMAGGAASMLGFAGYFVALQHAPVAAATVVYYTYPVLVLLLSAAIWHQPLRLREGVVCASVLLGVVLAVGPIGVSGALLVALLPALAAPVGWAVFLLVLSGPASEMPTLAKVFAGAAGGTLALLPLTLWTSGPRLLPLESGAIASVGLLTLCTLAIPAVLVTWGAARSGERATAMIGSLEFAVAVSAGWALMGDRLGVIQLAGIALVLAGAAMAATDNRRTVATAGTHEPGRLLPLLRVLTPHRS